MKLQDQVCSLEQSKRLLELGVKQGISPFYYEPWRQLTNPIQYNPGGYNLSGACFSAFTVAELGVMLPQFSGLNEGGGWDHPTYLDKSCTDGKPWIAVWEYDTDNGGMKREVCSGATEAAARAEMLILLLEWSVITAQEVNKRLESE